MNNVLEFYEQQLKEKQDALQRVIEQLTPLQAEKAEFEESIKSLAQLIAAERKKGAPINNKLFDDISPTMPEGRFTGKVGMEAYMDLANIDLRGKSFKEKEIRELANKEGLLINGDFISGSYSRALLMRMVEKGLLEKIGQGLYRSVEQKQAESSSGLHRRRL